MSEQEIVDYFVADRDPHYQSNRLDSCGHFNCSYHGLCSYVELLNIFGSHAAIEAYIQKHSAPKIGFCLNYGRVARVSA